MRGAILESGNRLNIGITLKVTLSADTVMWASSKVKTIFNGWSIPH